MLAEFGQIERNLSKATDKRSHFASANAIDLSDKNLRVPSDCFSAGSFYSRSLRCGRQHHLHTTAGLRSRPAVLSGSRVSGRARYPERLQGGPSAFWNGALSEYALCQSTRTTGAKSRVGSSSAQYVSHIQPSKAVSILCKKGINQS